jgi:hypothetical protein
MSRIRFATMRALFETFPEALKNIRAEPTDEPPLAFLDRLAVAGKQNQAVEVCAYLLPRRESVWWGCASARILLGGRLPADTGGLIAAEAWVQDPSEENRVAALDIGTKGDSNEPLTWLALAAGWSSGTFPPTPLPIPAFMTSRAVRISLLISMRSMMPEERAKLLQSCLSEGIQLAETG